MKSFGWSVGRSLISFIGMAAWRGVEIGTLEPLEGQALKPEDGAGPGGAARQDFMINPPENGVRRPLFDFLPILGPLNEFSLQT